ncbi:hypothetical protein [Nocardia salmonicida]|uniref:hypothetical protein n=1 Tax=Nocardia salmonicida TaxID=53431 RepID=UPI0007A4B6E7|nr:hypothetical protein [Nocardia salmonicida]MBC7299505.1 hypothetical protein [Nocardia sp.]
MTTSFTHPILADVTVYPDGAGVLSPRREHEIEHDPEAPTKLGLWIDVDLGLLSQSISVDLDLPTLAKFVRRIENRGRLRPGEHVLDLTTNGPTRGVVQKVVDDDLVEVDAGFGVYRVDVGHLHRLYRTEEEQPE